MQPFNNNMFHASTSFAVNFPILTSIDFESVANFIVELASVLAIHPGPPPSLVNLAPPTLLRQILLRSRSMQLPASLPEQLALLARATMPTEPYLIERRIRSVHVTIRAGEAMEALFGHLDKFIVTARLLSYPEPFWSEVFANSISDGRGDFAAVMQFAIRRAALAPPAPAVAPVPLPTPALPPAGLSPRLAPTTAAPTLASASTSAAPASTIPATASTSSSTLASPFLLGPFHDFVGLLGMPPSSPSATTMTPASPTATPAGPPAIIPTLSLVPTLAQAASAPAPAPAPAAPAPAPASGGPSSLTASPVWCLLGSPLPTTASGSAGHACSPALQSFMGVVDAAMDLASRLDGLVREAADFGLTGTPAFAPSPSVFPAASAYPAPAPAPAPAPDPAFPSPALPVSPTMTVTMKHPGKLTPSERSYLTQNHGCFKCRRLGHLSPFCPGDPEQGVPPGERYVPPQPAAPDNPASRPPASRPPAPPAGFVPAPSPAPQAAPHRPVTRSVTRNSSGRPLASIALEEDTAAISVSRAPANFPTVLAQAVPLQSPAAMPDGAPRVGGSPAADPRGPCPPGETPGLFALPLTPPAHPPALSVLPPPRLSPCPASLASGPETRSDWSATPLAQTPPASETPAPAPALAPAVETPAPGPTPILLVASTIAVIGSLPEPSPPGPATLVPLDELPLAHWARDVHGRTFVCVGLGSDDLRALADTGAAGNFVAPATADRLGLHRAPLDKPVTAHSPLGGLSQVREVASGTLCTPHGCFGVQFGLVPGLPYPILGAATAWPLISATGPSGPPPYQMPSSLATGAVDAVDASASLAPPMPTPLSMPMPMPMPLFFQPTLPLQVLPLPPPIPGIPLVPGSIPLFDFPDSWPNALPPASDLFANLFHAAIQHFDESPAVMSASPAMPASRSPLAGVKSAPCLASPVLAAPRSVPGGSPSILASLAWPPSVPSAMPGMTSPMPASASPPDTAQGPRPLVDPGPARLLPRPLPAPDPPAGPAAPAPVPRPPDPCGSSLGADLLAGLVRPGEKEEK